MGRLSVREVLPDPSDEWRQVPESFVPNLEDLPGNDYLVPFGIPGRLFMVLPKEVTGASIPSIYPTVTDKNDREGDKD